MTLLEIFRVAVRALLRNKMRTFLTTLGMIIGVGAVIAMVAIGEGAKARVEESLAAMGSNMLIVSSGSARTGGSRGGSGSLPTLTWADLQAIQAEVRSVRWAAPVLRTTATVASEDQNWNTTVTGTTPEYFDLRSWDMDRGTCFSTTDVQTGRKVVVLGQAVVERLYGRNADPLGHMVRIRNIPFEVVAVMERKGQSTQGQDFDDAVFIPVTTYTSQIQGGLQSYIAGTIFVGAVSADATQRAETEIARLLRERHRIQPRGEDDFSVRNLSETAHAREEQTRTLSVLLASIAAVSLLVGGIGIMNIMLVSVTERTREIGVRMAVGATPGQIRSQFLVEALTVAVAGGCLGVLFGMVGAERLAASFGWPVLVRVDVIVVSVVFSALVGVGFGLYPAIKASRLDPIEALRYE